MSTARPKTKAAPAKGKRTSPKKRASLARAHSEPATVAQVQRELSDRASDGAIIAELSRRFTPEKICNRLEALCDAMTPPIKTKDGNLVSRPDCSTRLRALDMLLAYLVGRPIERSMSIRADKPVTWDDMQREASQSPAMRETAIAALIAMRSGNASGQATASK